MNAFLSGWFAHKTRKFQSQYLCPYGVKQVQGDWSATKFRNLRDACVATSEPSESNQVTSYDGYVLEKMTPAWLNKKFVNFTWRNIVLNPAAGPC